MLVSCDMNLGPYCQKFDESNLDFKSLSSLSKCLENLELLLILTRFYINFW